MSTPAIPIDPEIIGWSNNQRAPASSSFAQDDSAIADESDDDDSQPAVASAIPRRFSKRQSHGASGSEVRRLSTTTRRRESSSARRGSNAAAGSGPSLAPGDGSVVDGATGGRYRSASVTTNDGGGARQRKYSSGRESLRPSNVFHIDSPVLQAQSSDAAITSPNGGGSPLPHSPLADDPRADSSTATSTSASRKPSGSHQDRSAIGLSTLDVTSTTTQRRPSHSQAQENGVVVHGHGLDRVDSKAGGGGMPTLGETQEWDVNQAATFVVQDDLSETGRDTGNLKQLRSKLILAVICVAQLQDNISMSSVNMCLPALSEELNLSQSDQAWLISAYTLAFGSFLLLAGVLADRYGKKLLFISGLIWMSIWVLACGFAQGLIQFAIFRALQGLGAAATVPSAVGILTNYFTGRERNLCLTIFGAAGALGFVVGLIYGGVLTDVLNWRWVFWLSTPIGSGAAVAAYFVLPNPKPPHNERRKSLDFIGAGVATSGLILLTFVLTAGEATGWGTSYVIAILVISVLLLAAFPVVERFVKDPILPNYLWKQPGFAATWLVGFLVYCWWQALVLYLTYISQNVLHLSALRTSLQFIPMGVFGAAASYAIGVGVNYFQIKTLVLVGLALCFISVIPAAVMDPAQGFWATIFPSSILGVIGISFVYNAVSIALMATMPIEAKAMGGGCVNTAFQIGAGFGVAIAAAVVTAVEDKTTGNHEAILLAGYKAGIWTTGGFCGAAFLFAVFGIKGGMLEVGPVH